MAGIGFDGGSDLGPGHGDHGVGLDLHALAVVLQHDIPAGTELVY